MTRARSHTWAVGISPLIQPLLEAVLCVVMSLVRSVRATFGMRFNRRDRDWHTAEMHEALPQTKRDIHIKEDTPPTESLSALCRESLLANPKGLAINPLETLNRDSRDKPENDTVAVETLEACKARVPGDLSPEARRAQGEGRDPASAQSALTKRTRLSPLIPTNVGIQGRLRVLFHPAASSLHTQTNRSWIPAFAGMSGECCLQPA